MAGAGDCQDFGGPFVLLRYDGSSWERVRELPNQGWASSITPDGRGGLWLAVCREGGGCPLLHYSDHEFATADLPIGKDEIRIDGVSTAPATGITYIAGQMYKGNPAGPVSPVIMRYEP